jgi:hypothetical protein
VKRRPRYRLAVQGCPARPGKTCKSCASGFCGLQKERDQAANNVCEECGGIYRCDDECNRFGRNAG